MFNLIKKYMANISVNNITYRGSSVSISNSKIVINGIDVTPNSKEITIQIDGDVETVNVDYANRISVNGNVGKIKCTSGDVSVTGTVKNSVESISGNISCGDVGGNVSTMSGNVKIRK